MASEIAKREIFFTEFSPSIKLLVCIGKNIAALARSTRQIIIGRRELARLADFDDRMLADIGLTRSDLRAAYSVPLWKNPTDILERLASHRAREAPRHR
jgi:uncharacterized protein YjiS (DUF1127 family)